MKLANENWRIKWFYITLTLESTDIAGFTFVWFTDGVGWIPARNDLKETFDVLDTVYNINDLENDVLERI